MKALLLENGLRHLGNRFAARTAFLLERNGFPMNLQGASISKDVASIISNQKHSRRITTTWGPLVFVREGEARNSAIPVLEMLIDPSAKRRRAAAKHLATGMTVLTRRTCEVIRENQRQVQQGLGRQWLRPAISIYDAVSSDWLFSLAGVNQCIDVHCDEGFNFFWPRLLKPSLSSLDSTCPPIWKPREQTEEFETRISECVQRADTLIEAVDAYYQDYGYLPLEAKWTIPRVVTEWVATSKTSEDVWSQIWMWAKQELDPVRQYHACSVFFHEPRFLPEHAAGEFWSEVAKVVDSADVNDPAVEEVWRFRNELAAHYCQYFECIVPGRDGEVMAASAWWLASQVVRTIATRELDIQDLCEKAVRPFESLSTDVRKLVHPPTKGSAFRYATLFLPSLWSYALLCQIGEKIDGLHADRAGSSERSAISKCMGNWLVTGFPNNAPYDQPVYAFDTGLESSARKWITAVGDIKQQTEFETLIVLKTRSHNLEELLDAVSEFVELSPSMQCFIAGALLGAAYSDVLPVDSLWNKLEDPGWRESALLRSSPEATAMICDMLLEAQAKAGGDWSTHLPHFLAMACETSSGEPERQRLLFSFVVLASVSTNTVSALRRLLQGRNKHCFRKYAQDFKTILESRMHTVESWVAARIRPPLTELSASV